MIKNVRHVMGISGGKDSAALAIYLKKKYPNLDIEYYFCDTGKELQETYDLINKLEAYLGKSVKKLKAAEASSKEDPFDHYFELFGGYLPSPTVRWCTKKLKIEPFEAFVGNDPVISYVGIRGDENREGYISTKPNIQSIFPFRKNIWSKDVVNKLLAVSNTELLINEYKNIIGGDKLNRVLELIAEPSTEMNLDQKVSALLDLGIREFNEVVLAFLKTTDYPLSHIIDFPLIDNEDVLVREDIFKLLRENEVGVPKYYEKIEYKYQDQTGEYARSRSGCYFCFYQQKIEWIWLYEQHPENGKESFTWNQNESLIDLIEPNRIAQIKRDHIKRRDREKSVKSKFLIDILDDTEKDGCIQCFI
jgi:3'-phosphoadenosine 5'-phosphosulfate sulfotransferase (PAPS reductase)/FAD synthetase